MSRISAINIFDRDRASKNLQVRIEASASVGSRTSRVHRPESHPPLPRPVAIRLLAVHRRPISKLPPGAFPCVGPLNLFAVVRWFFRFFSCHCCERALVSGGFLRRQCVWACSRRHSCIVRAPSFERPTRQVDPCPSSLAKDISLISRKIFSTQESDN